MVRSSPLPRRTKYLTVPLTETEQAQFRDAADKVRLPVATWIRNFVLNALEKEND